MSDELLQIILFIVSVVLLSALIGWIISRIRIGLFMKKLDKKINLPETIKEIDELILESKLADIKREENQNDRRRKLYGESGNKPINPNGRRGPETKGTIEQPFNKGRAEGRSDFQDSDLNKDRQYSPRDEGTDRSADQTEQESDWAW